MHALQGRGVRRSDPPPPLPLIQTDFVNLYNKEVNENKKLNKEASETYHTAVLVQIPSCYRKNMD